MLAIDLFAGGGGTSLGADWAGLKVVWAANHKPAAVAVHLLNHPNTLHVCQDLHQANWDMVPNHDVTLASPCCQGHSLARGKSVQSQKADESRSTAYAVLSCLEIKKPQFGFIENVVEFQKWVLYDIWVAAIERLGYSVAAHVVNCNTLGVPQSRKRLFIIITRSANKLWLDLPVMDLVPATSFLDLNMAGHNWENWADRVPATVRRITQGRKDFGEIFIDTAYGSERTGHSIHKPIGTITTVNKHSLVIGDKVRPLTIQELAKAQTFPSTYQWAASKTDTKQMIGNAVPPRAAEIVLRALKEAA